MEKDKSNSKTNAKSHINPISDKKKRKTSLLKRGPSSLSALELCTSGQDGRDTQLAAAPEIHIVQWRDAPDELDSLLLVHALG